MADSVKISSGVKIPYSDLILGSMDTEGTDQKVQTKTDFEIVLLPSCYMKGVSFILLKKEGTHYLSICQKYAKKMFLI